jgi:hypothetical protein
MDKQRKLPKVKIKLAIPVEGQKEHLAIGTVHEVIDAPKEHRNSKIPGIWVMGTAEPVKLLSAEYDFVNE